MGSLSPPRVFIEHQCGHVQVLESYLKTQEGNGSQDQGAGQDRVEFGEIELYRVSILHEAGKHEAAMALLKERSSRICDRLGAMELQASIQFPLGNLEEAANLYRRLISAIPDNYDYHRCISCALRTCILVCLI